MTSGIKNIEASVKARLQNKAKESGRPFFEILQYYAMERFLYRFAQSKYAKSFILKGALMFSVWNVPARRTTMDIDFLARFDNQIEKIEQVMKTVCAVTTPSDGLIFDEKTVKGQRIKENADYQGVRVKFIGFLEKSRIPMQIDIGFGDVISPQPVSIEYPVILDFPAPQLQGYTFESVVAEKFEAMIKLGMLNSRMKDFYDVWLIRKQFQFENKKLASAIEATFKNRKTPLPAKLPLFAGEIYDNHSDQALRWKTFLKKNEITNAPETLSEVARIIEEFLRESLESISSEQ